MGKTRSVLLASSKGAQLYQLDDNDAKQLKELQYQDKELLYAS